MKKQCPMCGGAVRYLSEKDVFCLDCNWDTLTSLTPTGIIAVDAEWYLKNQLRKYRKWKDADFERVTPDWSVFLWVELSWHIFSSSDRRKTRRDRPFPDEPQGTATPHPRQRKNKLSCMDTVH